jgi:hypothetical protein
MAIMSNIPSKKAKPLRPGKVALPASDMKNTTEKISTYPAVVINCT